MKLFEKITIAALAVVAAGSVTGMTINGVNNKKQAEAIEELRAKDAYLQRQINDLKKQYEELKAQEEADIARVTAEYQSKIDALTAQLNQTKNDLANLKSQQSKDKTELLNKISSLTSQINSLQTQMNNKIKEIEDKYNAEIEKLLAKIAALEGDDPETIDSPSEEDIIVSTYYFESDTYRWRESTTNKDFYLTYDYTGINIKPEYRSHGSYVPYLNYLKFTYFSKYKPEDTQLALTAANVGSSFTKDLSKSDLNVTIVGSYQYNTFKYSDFISYEYYYENTMLIRFDDKFKATYDASYDIFLKLIPYDDLTKHCIDTSINIELGHNLINQAVIL